MSIYKMKKLTLILKTTV